MRNRIFGTHHEAGDNDIAIAGATGQFNSKQVNFEAGFDKRFNFGQHWIEPTVKVSYLRQTRDGYTDSAGFVIASSGATTGRLTYGPKFGTVIDGFGPIKQIMPYAKFGGVWDFDREADATLSSGVVLANASTAVNLGGGTQLLFLNGLVLSVAGDWYSFNTELSAWSVAGRFGGPLSAFGGLPGFAPNAFISLDLAAAEANAAATVRLTIKSQ
jgi:outer membrane autotransporter protein